MILVQNEPYASWRTQAIADLIGDVPVRLVITHIYNHIYIYISWLISSLTGFYGCLWQIYWLVRVRYCINQLDPTCMCGQSDSAPSGNPKLVVS